MLDQMRCTVNVKGVTLGQRSEQALAIGVTTLRVSFSIKLTERYGGVSCWCACTRSAVVGHQFEALVNTTPLGRSG